VLVGRRHSTSQSVAVQYLIFHFILTQSQSDQRSLAVRFRKRSYLRNADPAQTQIQEVKNSLSERTFLCVPSTRKCVKSSQEDCERKYGVRLYDGNCRNGSQPHLYWENTLTKLYHKRNLKPY
jgi:hypothetical protein